MTTHYTSSNGKVHVITEMADGHIHNSLAKLQREEPNRSGEISAMAAEVAKRDAAAKEKEADQ